MIGKTSWRRLKVGVLILALLSVISCSGPPAAPDLDRDEKYLIGCERHGYEPRLPVEVFGPDGELVGTVTLLHGKGAYFVRPGGEQIMMWEQKEMSDLWTVSLLENPRELRAYYLAQVWVPPAVKAFHRDMNLETGVVKNWKMSDDAFTRLNDEMNLQLGGSERE